jgi:hypothetical protein
MTSSTYASFTEISHRSSYPDISPSNPILSATGKVILITGGGSGIGKAIAIAFSEAQAAVVVLIGRTEAHLRATQAELSLVTTKHSQLFFIVTVKLMFWWTMLATSMFTHHSQNHLKRTTGEDLRSTLKVQS